jgi:hypothetical protein
MRIQLFLVFLAGVMAHDFPATFRASYRKSLSSDQTFNALKTQLEGMLSDKASLVTAMNYCADGSGDGVVAVYAKLESCGFDYDR